MKVIEQPVEKDVTTSTTYNFGLAYLRAFLVVLVVAHHAVLAYFPMPRRGQTHSWRDLGSGRPFR